MIDVRIPIGPNQLAKSQSERRDWCANLKILNRADRNTDHFSIGSLQQDFNAANLVNVTESPMI